MTTHIEISSPSADVPVPPRVRTLRYAVPVGRVLFAAIFVASALGHFSQETVAYAASQGVPFANFLVPLSGLIALAGGLSVMFGLHARYGAALLVLFLLPVTLTMHSFWSSPDVQTAMIQRVMFMKNLSMLGGALLLVYFGAGPFSVDVRRRRQRRPS